MKIAVGSGVHLEPDDEPRNTPWHKRMVRVEKAEGYRAVYNVTLECGHGVQYIGDLALAGGVAFCTKCRDLAEGE